MGENKLEKLNEYIIEHLKMRLHDNTINSVENEIKGMEKTITNEEFKNDDHTQCLKTISELKKYKDYDCLYAIDDEYGGMWGQGYIIVGKDLEYKDFIRTI